MGSRNRGGHQIVRLRRRTRKVPEWTRNDKQVRIVLLRAFPKLALPGKDRTRAARWMRVIHLYFRLQYTYSQVAEELTVTPGSVMSMTRSIQRVAQNRRANGTGQLGKKRGRPKKLFKNSCHNKRYFGK